MIGRFGEHCGLGVPDGLVEPAELGEHVGEPGQYTDRTRVAEVLVAPVASSAAFRSNKVAAALGSLAAWVMPRKTVAATSIERSLRVRAILRASCRI
jgi:hypothetical protein